MEQADVPKTSIRIKPRARLSREATIMGHGRDLYPINLLAIQLVGSGHPDGKLRQMVICNFLRATQENRMGHRRSLLRRAIRFT
ncbi:hypothetical protein VDGE_30651 [Verticillium dahliae]|uniref:Uncharacterized protein n=1 Tax=Verticillium dahliae TaxID=27337 RepID=A0A444S4Z9_VERDA|nr:hypothetical protein VDGE_30651 [Verticillium dahliae]